MGVSELLTILPAFKDQPFLQAVFGAITFLIAVAMIRWGAKDKAAASSPEAAGDAPLLHMQGPLAVSLSAITELRDIQREVRDGVRDIREAVREGKDTLKEMRDLTRSNNEALREGRDRQARMVELLDDIKDEQLRGRSR